MRTPRIASVSPCTSLRAFAPLVLLLIIFLAGHARSQSLDNFDRKRGREMLNVLKEEIRNNYYDLRFHGIDLDARFKLAEAKINEATSMGQVLGIIAQALLDFNDSHTFFLPPDRTVRVQYGWQMQMIGDKCYVIAVKPGSDAEAKGLKVGDLVRSIGGFAPTRADLWKMNYFYNTLRPQPALKVVIQSPGGNERQLEVASKMTEKSRVLNLTGSDGGSGLHELINELEKDERANRQRYVELGDELMIWKMPSFVIEQSVIDDMMSKAKKHKALILDLRSNPGGYEDILLRLIGFFFDRETKVGDIKTRKDAKPMKAKPRGDKSWEGAVTVLVDSRSASAAELFARVMQLEKRGMVIGDRTSGAVMGARAHIKEMGSGTILIYGASITEQDIVMTDGKSLEGTGVTPDKLMIPSAEDLAALRDPVLSYAAGLAGVKLPAEKAGSLFPIEWRK